MFGLWASRLAGRLGGDAALWKGGEMGGWGPSKPSPRFKFIVGATPPLPRFLCQALAPTRHCERRAAISRCVIGQPRQRVTALLLLLAVALTLSTPLQAQTQTPPADPDPTPIQVQALSQATGQPIGQGQQALPQAVVPFPPLEDFLRRVDANHPKLRGGRALVRSAQGKLLEKQGAFDPTINGWAGGERYNATTSRGLPGKAKSYNGYIAETSVKTRLGIEYGVGAEWIYGEPKSPLSYTGDGGEYYFKVKVPLLRGLGINEKNVAERQALFGTWEADAAFQQLRLSTLMDATEAYWNVVAAQKALLIAQQLEALAATRLTMVEKRAMAGDLPTINVVEAKQTLQSRQATRVKAERVLQKTQNKFWSYLWADNGQPEPQLTQLDGLQTTDFPDRPADLTLLNPEAIYQAARQGRPEFKYLDAQTRTVRESLKLARNLRLPALDANVALGRDTGSNNIGTTLKAAVVLSAVPFRQREARGQIQQAEAKLEKLGLELQQLAQQLKIDAQDIYSELTLLLDRLDAVTQEVQFAQQMEAGERTKFDLGDSTLFMVNQREAATAQARLKLIELQTELAVALTFVRAIQGQL